MFGTQQSELFTDDSWRNASITNLQTEDGMSPSYDNRAGNDPTDDEMNSFSSMAAPSNISTFDNLSQTLKMFDSDDAQNWRILGLTEMLLVPDTIALILEQPSQIQLDADKKRKTPPLPRLEVSSRSLRS